MESNTQGVPWENEGLKSQKMDLEWASVWKATCKEFHSQMQDCGCQWVLRDNTKSQKMQLEWASVRTVKCKEFHKKMLTDSANSQKMELEWARKMLRESAIRRKWI